MKIDSVISLLGVSLFLLCLVCTVSAFDQIGVFQNGIWYLDYNGNGFWTSGDEAYNFGAPGWTSIIGDWNGDGRTEVAVYQNGAWYLDWNGNGVWDAEDDKAYTFGTTGWTSVVGDWNGDGKGTKIGVYKDGAWYLDWNGNGVWDAEDDKAYTFGTTGWISVVGDWNGDGKGTKIGVYKDGAWYLDWNGNGVWDAEDDKAYTFGTTGWISVVGDWNGDGKGTKIGVYKDGAWYLDWNGNGVWDAEDDRVYTFGAAGWTLVLGDWNGDGKGTKIGVYKDGLWYLDWNGNGVWDAESDKANYFGGCAWTPVIGKWISASPSSAFTSTARTGFAPLSIRFTDQSTNSPTAWKWEYKKSDGSWTEFGSGAQNPTNIFAAGSYDIRLTVSNTVGITTKTEVGYITVNAAPVAPLAAFTSTVRTGTAPLTVKVTDQSTNSPTAWKWEYKKSDGSWTEFDSGAQNPTNIFAAGTYDIRLTASNAVGSNTNTKTGYITVNPAPIAPVAAFTSSVRTGTAPLTVKVTDQSTNSPTAWKWEYKKSDWSWTEFGSGAQNPTNIFAAGTYDIRLTATNAVGSNTNTKTGYIIVAAPIAPVATFTSNVQNGTAPLIVQFTDKSTGTSPLTYAWDFNNDANTDSSSKSPSFTYSTAGTYSVKLTITNIAGTNSTTRTDYIIVAAPIAPVAIFTSNVQTGAFPLLVRFTDTSTGTIPLIYAWDFNNDEKTDSSSKSPSFTYAAAGTYSVNLTVTNIAGTDSMTKTNYIIVTAPVAPVTAFTSTIQSGTSPLPVRFTDESTNTPTAWKWEYKKDAGSWTVFGSGAQNPSNIFNTGVYGIRLTATNAGGSDTLTETGYITVNEKPPGPSDAGIAITFDDYAVDRWYAIRDLLNQYDAHVTFFVSDVNSMTDGEINKLKILQQDGHEIAFHGYNHVEADTYLQTHTVQEYLDTEIIPGVDLMNNKGFYPVDFAYPGGAGTDALTKKLEDYFVHIRYTAYGSPLKNVNSVFYQYGSHTAPIYGIGLDESYGHSMDEIYDGIAKAKNDDKILIFYAHVPVTSDPGSSQISIDRIEKTLRNASENNLKFYTISEIE